jgi:hypothetical protein
MKQLKNYFAPTPKKWKVIGDSIFLLGTMLTGQQIYAGNNNIALAALILTWAGKTITNFATATDDTNNLP